MEALSFSGIPLLLCAAVLVLLFIKLIKLPLRWAFKLLIHALIGFAALFVLNYLGAGIGVSLEMSWLNAIIAGVLGVPGVILLLILKYFL